MGALETGSESQTLRLGASLRQEDRVLPLELFFDLVFVLAITQCTTLMSHHTTWGGSARACWSSRCSGGRGWATPG